MKLRPLTVTEVNQYIKKVFDYEPILNNVVVDGEISNYTLHSSGHSYFTIKDENSRLSCVMFRRDHENIGIKLYNGLKIQAHGKISVYERDGKYQLYVRDIKQSGIGDLYIRFEKLKEKLFNEGLFDTKLKKELPEFPKKVAVITSPTGAAVRDIINVITRRTSSVDIMVVPVRVQGEESKYEIVEAIDKVNKLKNADVIILGRGGGSIEELWSFNEEIVARAIFDSKIPIISGVGHETDYTISDFVSDLRAPTPSAAAELAVKNEIDIKANLDGMLYTLYRIQDNKIKRLRSTIDNLSINRLSGKLGMLVDSKSEDLDHFYNSMSKSMNHKVRLQKEVLNYNGMMLNSFNPLNILNKGYSLTFDTERNLIKSVKEAHINQEIDVQLRDGKLVCTVNDISEEA